MDIPARLEALLRSEGAHRLLQYQGVWSDVSRVAESVRLIDRHLVACGVGAGARVALIMRNRPLHVAAIIALFASRRCLVPVTSIQSDTATVSDIERTGATVVLADAEDWNRTELLSGCARLGVRTIRLGDSAAESVAGTGADRPPDPAEGVAVMMPTSGTTGTPKRIPYTYEQLGGALDRVANYSPATRRALGGPLAPRRGVVVATLTMAHVAGFWTVLQALCEGRPIALLDRFEPLAWADLVAEHQVAMAMIPPSTLAMVLDQGVAPAKLGSLKGVVCGTAPLDPEVGRQFTARYGVPVLTAYGATEFPGGIVGWSIGDYHAYHESKKDSVGRPRPGIRVRVVDAESGKEVPTGDEGLIAVYSPQATNPAEDGWVTTNDIGHLDADGFLYVRGRADDAINRGGFKIVPQVLEATLRTHPAVVEAAVVGCPDARLGQVPVAALETRSPVQEQELLAWLRERVPKYQIPVEIRFLERLPRTASLKVSKQEVRELFRTGRHVAERQSH